MLVIHVIQDGIVRKVRVHPSPRVAIPPCEEPSRPCNPQSIPQEAMTAPSHILLSILRLYEGFSASPSP